MVTLGVTIAALLVIALGVVTYAKMNRNRKAGEVVEQPAGGRAKEPRVAGSDD